MKRKQHAAQNGHMLMLVSIRLPHYMMKKPVIIHWHESKIIDQSCGFRICSASCLKEIRLDHIRI